MALSQDPVPGRSALVLYGSETGSAQDIAEELGRLTERLRFATRVLELNNCSLNQLLKHTIVLFAISTTGQGDLPANAQSFWKSIRSARLRPGCLQKVNFVSFGLGDSSYPQFNWAHRKLFNRLVQLGAIPIYDRGESDEQHPEGIDGSFLPWSIGLYERICNDYPLPEGVTPIPNNVLLRPKWELQLLKADQATSMSINPPISGRQAYDDQPDDSLLSIPSGLVAKVETNERVTATSHWQDVRHLTLSTPPVSYSPGDVLTIYPKNFPSDVSNFLDIMKWTSVADEPLCFHPTMQNHAESPEYPSPPVKNIDTSRPLTLRLLLTNHLDIMAIPRRSFFAILSHFTEDNFQHNRLLEFTDPQYIDELYDYTTRPRRSILEVLQEFETVKVPWQSVCSLVPTIRGRQFSIASGGNLKRGPAITNIELLIAIVKYRTVIKRVRQGVCTRYVATLRPGSKLSVTLQRGSLSVKREDLNKPVIMIGPGTGIAPLRSLVHERDMYLDEVDSDNKGRFSSSSRSRDILFFGCRNRASDYFFEREWHSFSQKRTLDIFTAFSRDQRQKVYVQDLIRKYAHQVFSAVDTNDGLVYVCGSSGKMPQAVREALIEVFQQEGRFQRKEAELYLANMEKTGRYKQETW
ncbi:sulfite reductase flavo protein alpha-component [Pseudovirgaria hyperparasitica]|uniref:NADPH-dependent diflavin oxidoreductase 1 n=1 Tax=Pseudovirgaria hyperparasitica TaxID=470096 RepID=A0A6A6WMW2_9PEZI|nr:sulfite reductase flavo protein alpha-component [Pseudovirgaria hyperparasitica]KAF2763463.1 sulfite reductase flavo protein alpha-component [Pseudovirgaria hyperparasitica]